MRGGKGDRTNPQDHLEQPGPRPKAGKTREPSPPKKTCTFDKKEGEFRVLYVFSGRERRCDVKACLDSLMSERTTFEDKTVHPSADAAGIAKMHTALAMGTSTIGGGHTDPPARTRLVITEVDILRDDVQGDVLETSDR